MNISNRAANIINRFPHFYHEVNQSNLLYLFVDVFARTLEIAETDLLWVMRSNHVDTANNYGSLGLDSSQKGDLDRLFSLYLEKLGATSQLIQVDREFKVTDLKQISSLVERLNPEGDSLSRYIWDNFGEERDLLNRYRVDRTKFEASDFIEPTSPLAVKLMVAQDALTLHLRDFQETKSLLQAYNGAENVSSELLNSLVKDFNRILGDRQLYKKFQELSVQIDLASRLHRWLNKDSALDSQRQKAIIIGVGQILRRRLSIKLQDPLYRQDSNKLTEQFWLDAIAELKQCFGNIFFCQQVLDTITEIIDRPNVRSIEPPEEFITLLNKAAIALKQLLAINSLQLQKPAIPQKFEYLLTNSLSKDNLQRRNRLILETVYGDRIRSSAIPSLAEVGQEIVEALNTKILSDSDFYKHNKAYFSQLALDFETQKLIEEQQKTENLTGDRLKRLNRLLLETAYPRSIKKSHDPYRERLKALIKVLRRGAATKAGIRDIVAANLGIFDDDPEAREAKAKIRIEEYATEAQNTTFTWVYPDPRATTAELTQPPWSISNPNPIPTTPNYIQVRLQDVTKVDEDSLNLANKALPYLIKPRLVNSQTGQAIEIQYSSTDIDEVRLNQTDVLELCLDGTIKVNGSLREGAFCELLSLPVGDSQWHFEALTEEPAARFGSGTFDLSTFDNEDKSQTAIDKQQATAFTVEVKWQIYKQTPGIFEVIVPWYIEGYTDKFADAKDHPRSQIYNIISRVKAAGVRAIVSYEYEFQEKHEIDDKLILLGERTWQEEQPQQDSNFDIRSQQSLKIEQDMSDNFIFAGVFDYTEFDSGNRFN